MNDRCYVIVRLNEGFGYTPDNLAHTTIFTNRERAEANAADWAGAYGYTYVVKELL